MKCTKEGCQSRAKPGSLYCAGHTMDLGGSDTRITRRKTKVAKRRTRKKVRRKKR